MVGTFTMFEIPAGSAKRGLGVGKTWYKAPLWAQKSFGPWTTYGGGGVTLVNAPGYRNFPFAGWLVQRDFGKKVTLGTEVFYHGPEGLAAPQTRPATLVDVGGYYKFRTQAFSYCSVTDTPSSGKRRTTPILGCIGLGARRAATSRTIPRAPRSTAWLNLCSWGPHKRRITRPTRAVGERCLVNGCRLEEPGCPTQKWIPTPFLRKAGGIRCGVRISSCRRLFSRRSSFRRETPGRSPAAG